MEKEVEFEIPEKAPYEANATKFQKNKLWKLGCKDQEVLDSLGRDQAEKLIGNILEKIDNEQSKRRVKTNLVLSVSAFFFGVMAMTVSESMGMGGTTYIALVVAMLGFFLTPLYADKLGVKAITN